MESVNNWEEILQLCWMPWFKVQWRLRKLRCVCKISHRRIRSGHTHSVQQPTWSVLRHRDRYNMSWNKWVVLGGDPVCKRLEVTKYCRASHTKILESKILQTMMHYKQILSFSRIMYHRVHHLKRNQTVTYYGTKMKSEAGPPPYNSLSQPPP
jgi:hypothetical protein